MTIMTKTVNLATKPKRAAPKSKYMDPIIQATFSGDVYVHDVIKSLGPRLRDENPTVVQKALIVVHAVLRSGHLDSSCTYIARSAIVANGVYVSPVSAAYAAYLGARIKSWSNLRRDIIRDKTDRIAPARLRQLTVEKGLLREVRETQRMIATLVEAKFYHDDIDDEVSMTALRLLTKDLLVLFTAVNEGVINVLEHYFEMSHVDATTALKIYKTFCRDTEKVVIYLGVAKKLGHVLNVPIPNLKHAPVSLADSLEEYLNDPNFEANRQEYKENKRIADGGEPRPKESTPVASGAMVSTSSTTDAKLEEAPKTQESNISFTDFFSSIEVAQTNMFNPVTGSPTLNYFQQQANFNPFLTSQTTGIAPFQQPLQQQMTGFQQPLQQQMTGFAPNPFMSNPLVPQLTGNPFMQQLQAPQVQPQSTGNPFAVQAPQPIFNQPTSNPFMAQQAQQTPFVQPQMTSFMQPQSVGTANPFRASMMPLSSPFGQSSSPVPFGHSAPRHSTIGIPVSPINGSPSSPNRASSMPFSGLGDAQKSSSPALLVAQKTGTRNPFNPSPEEAAMAQNEAQKAAQKAAAGPSMNQIFNSFQQQQMQKQAQQQQESNVQETILNPQNGVSNPWGVSAAPVTSTSGASTVQTLLPSKTGGLFSEIASDFARPPALTPIPQLETSFAISTPLQPQVTSFFAGSFVKPFQPTSTFGTSTMDTGSLIGQSTGFTNTLQSQTTEIGGSSVQSSQPALSFGMSSTDTTPLVSQSTGYTSALQPQVTGFAGSSVKPFQPSSSFGTELNKEMTSLSLTSQPTGVSSPPTGLTTQATGFNPFRTSTVLPPLSTPLSAGITTVTTQIPTSQPPTGSLI